MNRRICAECGQEMKLDGVQRFIKLGYEYDLYTCRNKDCKKLYGFTFAGPKRPISKG